MKDNILVHILLPSTPTLSISPLLPIREGLPGEHNHLLVPLRDKPNMVKHFRQKPRCVRSPGEPKQIYVVPRRVEAHQEFVSAYHMLVE